MSERSYLIDTNILIGLEDNREVEAAYSSFSALAAKYKLDVFVHEAAKRDIARDKDHARRKISLSKIDKYRLLKPQRGVTVADLEKQFGPLKKPNDEVDAALLHSLDQGAAAFLVSQDQGLHERAEAFSPELGRRVLYIGDAADLIVQTYEPKEVPIRHVAEVEAHEIDHTAAFFDSLRDGYPEFDNWWRKKCIEQHRPCWVVYDDDELAGLIVRKDEPADDTDAISPGQKFLKICTFKVSPEKRGVKLGELLLKQVFWFAQANGYDVAYVTLYAEQKSLLGLLEYYGFKCTYTKEDGELVYERSFSREALAREDGQSPFVSARLNYPRFVLDEKTEGFGIPIQEGYHDILFPDLYDPFQPDLFAGLVEGALPRRPGNTIRKVYLCRAASNLGAAGSLLFFYKGQSKNPPSQSITAIGILDSVALARSTSELLLLTGGRSVYSESDLDAWGASTKRPVKVINYLLANYIDPPIELAELRGMGVVRGMPQQSIYRLSPEALRSLSARANLGFQT